MAACWVSFLMAHLMFASQGIRTSVGPEYAIAGISSFDLVLDRMCLLVDPIVEAHLVPCNLDGVELHPRH